MILSDSSLKEYIKSSKIGFESNGKYDIFSQIGPASIDFRLGNIFKYFNRESLNIIDTKKGISDDDIKVVEIDDGKSFILHPGQFILGVTLEKIRVPYDLVARCEGRSSLGRLGLIIHSTAGFIDPGFEGNITLEITNINEVPITLYPGTRVGQFAFETVHGEVLVPYDKRKSSKYMGQTKPQISKINNDFD